MVLAYGSLFIATAAQLVVPQFLQNIIDTVVRAVIAAQVLALPANEQPLAAQKVGQSLAELQAQQSGAGSAS